MPNYRRDAAMDYALEKWQETQDPKWHAVFKRLYAQGKEEEAQLNAANLNEDVRAAYGNPEDDGFLSEAKAAVTPIAQSVADYGPMIAGGVALGGPGAIAAGVADIALEHPLGKWLRSARGMETPPTTLTDKAKEAALMLPFMSSAPLARIIGGGVGAWGLKEKMDATRQGMESVGLTPDTADVALQTAIGPTLKNERNQVVSEGNPLGVVMDLSAMGHGAGELVTGPQLPFGIRNPVGQWVGNYVRESLGTGADAPERLAELRQKWWASKRMGAAEWVDGKIAQYQALPDDPQVREAWLDQEHLNLKDLARIFPDKKFTEGVFGRSKSEEGKAFVDEASIVPKWIEGEPIVLEGGTIETKGKSLLEVKEEILKHELAHVQQYRDGTVANVARKFDAEPNMTPEERISLATQELEADAEVRRQDMKDKPTVPRGTVRVRPPEQEIAPPTPEQEAIPIQNEAQANLDSLFAKSPKDERKPIVNPMGPRRRSWMENIIKEAQKISREIKVMRPGMELANDLPRESVTQSKAAETLAKIDQVKQAALKEKNPERRKMLWDVYNGLANDVDSSGIKGIVGEVSHGMSSKYSEAPEGARGAPGMEQAGGRTEKPLAGISDAEISDKIRFLNRELGEFPRGDTEREQLAEYLQGLTPAEAAKFMGAEPTGVELNVRMGRLPENTRGKGIEIKKGDEPNNALQQIKEALNAGHTVTIPATDAYLSMIKILRSHFQENPWIGGRVKLLFVPEKGYGANVQGGGRAVGKGPWRDLLDNNENGHFIYQRAGMKETSDPIRAEGDIIDNEARNATWQPTKYPTLEDGTIADIEMYPRAKGPGVIAQRGLTPPSMENTALAMLVRGGSKNETVNTVGIEALANRPEDQNFAKGEAQAISKIIGKMPENRQKQIQRMKDELYWRKEASKFFPAEMFDIVNEGERTVLTALGDEEKRPVFRIPLEEVRNLVEYHREVMKGESIDEEVSAKFSDQTEKLASSETRMGIDVAEEFTRSVLGKNWKEDIRPVLEKVVTPGTLEDLDVFFGEYAKDGKLSVRRSHALKKILSEDEKSIENMLTDLFAKASDSLAEGKVSDHWFDRFVDFASKAVSHAKYSMMSIMPGHDYLETMLDKVSSAWSVKGVNLSPDIGVTVKKFREDYNSRAFPDVDENSKVTVHQFLNALMDEKQQGKAFSAKLDNGIRSSGLIEAFHALTDKDVLTRRWDEWVNPTTRDRVRPHLTANDKAFLAAYEKYVAIDKEVKQLIYTPKQFKALENEEYYRRQLKVIVPPEELIKMDSVDRGIIGRFVASHLAEMFGVDSEIVLSQSHQKVVDANPELRKMAHKYTQVAAKMVSEIQRANPGAPKESVLNVVARHVRQAFGAMTEENIAKTIADDPFLGEHVNVGADVMHRKLPGGYGAAHESDVRNVIPRQIQSVMKTLPNVQMARMLRDFVINGNQSISDYLGNEMKGFKDYVTSELRNTFFGGVIEDTMAPSVAASAWDAIFGTRLMTQPNSLWATANAASAYMYRNLLSWRPNFLAMNTLDPVLKTMVRYSPEAWMKYVLPTYMGMVADALRPGSKLLELAGKYVAPKGSLISDVQGGTMASPTDTGIIPNLVKGAIGEKGYTNAHALMMWGPHLIEGQEHFNNKVIWAIEANKMLHQKMITDNPKLAAKYDGHKMLDLYLESGSKPWGVSEAEMQTWFRRASGSVESIQGHRSGFMGGSAAKSEFLSGGRNNVKAAAYVLSKMFMNYPTTILLGLTEGMQNTLNHIQTSRLQGKNAEAIGRLVFNPLTLMMAASAAAYYGVPYTVQKVAGQEPEKFNPLVLAQAAFKDLGYNQAPVPFGMGMSAIKALSGFLGMAVEGATGEFDLETSKGWKQVKQGASGIASPLIPGYNAGGSLQRSALGNVVGLKEKKGRLI